MPPKSRAKRGRRGARGKGRGSSKPTRQSARTRQAKTPETAKSAFIEIDSVLSSEDESLEDIDSVIDTSDLTILDEVTDNSIDEDNVETNETLIDNKRSLKSQNKCSENEESSPVKENVSLSKTSPKKKSPSKSKLDDNHVGKSKKSVPASDSDDEPLITQKGNAKRKSVPELKEEETETVDQEDEPEEEGEISKSDELMEEVEADEEYEEVVEDQELVDDTESKDVEELEEEYEEVKDASDEEPIQDSESKDVEYVEEEFEEVMDDEEYEEVIDEDDDEVEKEDIIHTGDKAKTTSTEVSFAKNQKKSEKGPDEEPNRAIDSVNKNVQNDLDEGKDKNITSSPENITKESVAQKNELVNPEERLDGDSNELHVQQPQKELEDTVEVEEEELVEGDEDMVEVEEEELVEGDEDMVEVEEEELIEGDEEEELIEGDEDEVEYEEVEEEEELGENELVEGGEHRIAGDKDKEITDSEAVDIIERKEDELVEGEDELLDKDEEMVEGEEAELVEGEETEVVEGEEEEVIKGEEAKVAEGDETGLVEGEETEVIEGEETEVVEEEETEVVEEEETEVVEEEEAEVKGEEAKVVEGVGKEVVKVKETGVIDVKETTVAEGEEKELVEEEGVIKGKVVEGKEGEEMVVGEALVEEEEEVVEAEEEVVEEEEEIVEEEEEEVVGEDKKIVGEEEEVVEVEEEEVVEGEEEEIVEEEEEVVEEEEEEEVVEGEEGVVELEEEEEVVELEEEEEVVELEEEEEVVEEEEEVVEEEEEVVEEEEEVVEEEEEVIEEEEEVVEEEEEVVEKEKVESKEPKIDKGLEKLDTKKSDPADKEAKSETEEHKVMAEGQEPDGDELLEEEVYEEVEEYEEVEDGEEEVVEEEEELIEVEEAEDDEEYVEYEEVEEVGEEEEVEEVEEEEEVEYEEEVLEQEEIREEEMDEAEFIEEEGAVLLLESSDEESGKQETKKVDKPKGTSAIEINIKTDNLNKPKSTAKVEEGKKENAALIKRITSIRKPYMPTKKELEKKREALAAKKKEETLKKENGQVKKNLNALEELMKSGDWKLMDETKETSTEKREKDDLSAFNFRKPTISGVQEGRPAVIDLILSVKEPLLGLEYIVEVWKDDEKAAPRYFCALCIYLLTHEELLKHLNHISHKGAYLNLHARECWNRFPRNQASKWSHEYVVALERVCTLMEENNMRRLNMLITSKKTYDMYLGRIHHQADRLPHYKLPDTWKKIFTDLKLEDWNKESTTSKDEKKDKDAKGDAKEKVAVSKTAAKTDISRSANSKTSSIKAGSSKSGKSRSPRRRSRSPVKRSRLSRSRSRSPAKRSRRDSPIGRRRSRSRSPQYRSRRRSRSRSPNSRTSSIRKRTRSRSRSPLKRSRSPAKRGRSPGPQSRFQAKEKIPVGAKDAVQASPLKMDTRDIIRTVSTTNSSTTSHFVTPKQVVPKKIFNPFEVLSPLAIQANIFKTLQNLGKSAAIENKQAVFAKPFPVASPKPTPVVIEKPPQLYGKAANPQFTLKNFSATPVKPAFQVFAYPGNPVSLKPGVAFLAKPGVPIPSKPPTAIPAKPAVQMSGRSDLLSNRPVQLAAKPQVSPSPKTSFMSAGRPDYPGSTRGDNSKKPTKPEYAAMSDKPEYQARSASRFDAPLKSSLKSDYPTKPSSKSEYPPKTSRSDYPTKTSRSEYPTRTSRDEYPTKPSRSEYSSKSSRSEPSRSEHTRSESSKEYPTKTSRTEYSTKPSRPEYSSSEERSSRPESTFKPEAIAKIDYPKPGTPEYYFLQKIGYAPPAEFPESFKPTNLKNVVINNEQPRYSVPEKQTVRPVVNPALKSTQVAPPQGNKARVLSYPMNDNMKKEFRDFMCRLQTAPKVDEKATQRVNTPQGIYASTKKEAERNWLQSAKVPANVPRPSQPTVPKKSSMAAKTKKPTNFWDSWMERHDESEDETPPPVPQPKEIPDKRGYAVNAYESFKNLRATGQNPENKATGYNQVGERLFAQQHVSHQYQQQVQVSDNSDTYDDLYGESLEEPTLDIYPPVVEKSLRPQATQSWEGNQAKGFYYDPSRTASKEYVTPEVEVPPYAQAKMGWAKPTRVETPTSAWDQPQSVPVAAPPKEPQEDLNSVAEKLNSTLTRILKDYKPTGGLFAVPKPNEVPKEKSYPQATQPMTGNVVRPPAEKVALASNIATALTQMGLKNVPQDQLITIMQNLGLLPGGASASGQGTQAMSNLRETVNRFEQTFQHHRF